MPEVDPRTALAVGTLGVAAAATGLRPAVVALALAALGLAWAAPGWPALGRRLLPVAGASLAVLIVWPLAPQAATATAVRALAASFSVLAAGAVVEWPRLVAALQGWGAGPSLVAFLVIAARHVETLGDEARQALVALRLRGALDRRANLPRATAALLACLLGSALGRADHVARALELRGFEGRLAPLPAWRPQRGEAGHYAAAALLLGVTLAEAVAWTR